MLLKQSKFTLILLLISWVLSQCLVLQHQYNEEHVQQTEGHFCLAQVSNNDELIDNDVNPAVVLDIKNHSYFNCKTTNHAAYSVTINARAPPIRIS